MIKTKKNNNHDNLVLWYNWYCISIPEIKYVLPDGWPDISMPITGFDIEDKLNIHATNPIGFNEVKWTYKYNSDKISNMICNGIIIPRGYKINSYNFPEIKRQPLILVNDYEGNLSLTLNRNELYGTLSFEEELFIDMCKEINAFLLKTDFLQFDSKGNFIIKSLQVMHPTLIDRYSYYQRPLSQSDLIFFKEGLTINLPLQTAWGTLSQIVAESGNNGEEL